MVVLHGGHVGVATLFLLLTTAVNSQTQDCTIPSGASGKCVNIPNCPPVLDLLAQVKAGTASSDSLRRIICGFRNKVPLVCCPTAEVTLSKTRNILPSRCGIRGLVDRVISGEDAQLLAWPWMALLESENPEGRVSFVCGGVLISEHYVLTAAHCVNDSAVKLKNVRLGEHTISIDPDCAENVCAPSFQNIAVEKIIIHEDYGLPRGCSRCNDIALLRLSSPVQLNNLHVSPICILTNLEKDIGVSQEEFKSRPTWVAGWGTTEPIRGSTADVLQQVQLSFSDNACNLDLASYPDRNMVLCAGGEGKDTCRGDSGGPMMMSNQGETRFYLVGIVSKGPRVCGADNTGGIYTNVNHYVSWIQQNL